MVVAVSKGMEQMKDGLQQLGYDVVTYGEYKMPIDAVVYHGSQLASNQMTNANFNSGHGVLMINATNKSIQEIDSMLKKKSYSPLFE